MVTSLTVYKNIVLNENEMKISCAELAEGYKRSS